MTYTVCHLTQRRVDLLADAIDRETLRLEAEIARSIREGCDIEADQYRSASVDLTDLYDWLTDHREQAVTLTAQPRLREVS